MKLQKRAFGALKDGTQVSCWSMENENGLCAEILDYGATVRSILAEATSSKVKQLEKISLCYSAADTGAAQRKALINMEVED